MKHTDIMRLNRQEFYKRIFKAVFQSKTMSAENAKILQKEYEDKYYILRPDEDKDVSDQEALDILTK